MKKFTESTVSHNQSHLVEMCDPERQEAWVERFHSFTYWELNYEWIKTISPTKLQLIGPIDDGLDEYRPNNI